MELLALYWSVMLVFYAAASKLRSYRHKFGFLEGLLNVVIYVLVFVMGMRMGANEEVTSNLDVIGVQAVGISVFVIGGSMFAVFIARKILGIDKKGIKAGEEDIVAAIDTESENEEGDSGLKTSLLILLCVVLGMLFGYFVIPAIFNDMVLFQNTTGDFMVVAICILLAFVGFNMGLDGKVVQNLKTAGLKAIIFPIAAIIGSLSFGAIYGMITPLTVGEGVAVSAGFGWYTLAPSLITEAGHVVAGAVSFVHNVIRETFGIIAIPFMAKKIGYLEATAIPGVAAMDVCLPIVERSCGSKIMVYSFSMGLIMNTVVPLVVPLALG
ncbi:MAG: lysine exporter LysO family protein [Firmicutes bacterium]|nr:lysine exporter LysO family protein [Bacillota bacterium]